MRDPMADTPSLAEQLLAHLRAHQSEWRDCYHLQRIGLVGSTARNEATASSDVDVWVELDPLTPLRHGSPEVGAGGPAAVAS